MNNTHLNYSEKVYLFADKFISQRAVLANLEMHPTGEKIPVKPLGDQMVLAAVIYLLENQYISLEVKDVKKLFLFPGKEAFVTKTMQGANDLTGIELKLFSNIAEETKLQDAVYKLLNSDETLPWGHIIKISKDSLAEKGYLLVTEEKKFLGKVKNYKLNPEIVSDAKFSEVTSALEGFKNDAEKYETVLKAVKKGITRREEHEDFDTTD